MTKMGRPALPERDKRKSVTISLRDPHLDIIDMLTVYFGTRSAVIQHCIMFYMGSDHQRRILDLSQESFKDKERVSNADRRELNKIKREKAELTRNRNRGN